MTAHDLGRLGEPHHQALELACARALARGDLSTAFRLADRRCRIRPWPEPHSHVLRAEALHRLGEPAAAIDDLAAALAIAPDDLAANRRMLAWAKGRPQLAAAKTLVACEHDPRILERAIELLRTTGARAVGRVEVHGASVEGWAAWQQAGPVRLCIDGEAGRTELVLHADPDHPLAAALGHAVAFTVGRPLATAPQVITVARGDDVIAATRTTVAHAAPRRHLTTAGGTNANVTVLVPVYGDVRATRACLQSLLGQIDKRGYHRVVIVDDASPDPRMRVLLDEIAHHRHVTILRNASNLGFVGAVNRGLDAIAGGDVVLLNADTIVPAGFIDRLALAARSSPDIGTVTPFSNNGEFTSFPLPNQPNPLGDSAEVVRLDALAARVNAGCVVDIPNGIGFCLFVTRACLDAVGGLSESYHRGYLEDVDFCLRARRHGFRNVCTPSVYVGHAGSRSFGKHKRALVVRNLGVITQRFPAYRGECADFLLADPLKTARQAIEAALPLPAHPTIVVTGDGAVAAVALNRASQLLADDAATVLVLTVHNMRGRPVATLRDVTDAAPHALEFALDAAGAGEDLVARLRRAQPARLEFLDLGRMPRELVEALLTLAIPHDVFIAHGELGLVAESEADVSLARRIVAGAGRIWVPDAQAEAFASTLSLGRTVTRLAAPAAPRNVVARSVVAATRLGVVVVRGGAREQQFLLDIVASLRRSQPRLDVVVAGATLDDTALLRAGAFVTGAVEADELAPLLRRLGCDRCLAYLQRPLFGHPLAAAAVAAGLPLAYADWSRGRSPRRPDDAPLDPGLSAAAVAERLTPWLEGRAS